MEGTEEKKRGERERAWEMCLFSWLERFNQVHIGAVNHKGLPLVCRSQRGAREQAEASLLRPQPLDKRKKKITAEIPLPSLPPVLFSVLIFILFSLLSSQKLSITTQALSQWGHHFNFLCLLFILSILSGSLESSYTAIIDISTPCSCR